MCDSRLIPIPASLDMTAKRIAVVAACLGLCLVCLFIALTVRAAHRPRTGGLSATFVGVTDDPSGASAPAGQVGFPMNADLGARAMSGEDITAVVGAWRAGAISRQTMLERLKRGEVLPDGRSVAQERALIHRTVEG